MFMVGFINNAGVGVVMMYLSNLSQQLDRNQEFAMFVVFNQAIPIITVIFNAVCFIQTHHESRLMLACYGFIGSYICVLISIHNMAKENMALVFAVLACLLQMAAFAFG